MECGLLAADHRKRRFGTGGFEEFRLDPFVAAVGQVDQQRQFMIPFCQLKLILRATIHTTNGTATGLFQNQVGPSFVVKDRFF